MADENLTPKKECWHKAFLEKLADTCNVRESCRHAGISRPTAYDERASNPGFKELWTIAIDEGIEILELEARRRASEGWDQPVYQGGKRVGTVRKFSHTLLMFLLKSHKPETYRDNIHHTGDMKHTLAGNLQFENMTPAQIEAEVKAIADRNTDGG